jgi:hypothetical protein
MNLTQAKRKIERLERLLEAERERAEKAWDGYRTALYEAVDLKMKLEAVQMALNGEGETK